MKELIGKEIKKIFLDNENALLKFLVIDELNCEKEIIYGFYGDCCSETWVSEFVGFVHGFHKEIRKVKEVKELSLGTTNLRSKQEVDEVYGVLLEYENNCHSLILYRNSSNGYYGGSYNLIESVNRYENLKFVELKDDYYEGQSSPSQN